MHAESFNTNYLGHSGLIHYRRINVSAVINISTVSAFGHNKQFSWQRACSVIHSIIIHCLASVNICGVGVVYSNILWTLKHENGLGLGNIFWKDSRWCDGESSTLKVCIFLSFTPFLLEILQWKWNMGSSRLLKFLHSWNIWGTCLNNCANHCSEMCCFHSVEPGKTEQNELAVNSLLAIVSLAQQSQMFSRQLLLCCPQA